MIDGQHSNQAAGVGEGNGVQPLQNRQFPDSQRSVAPNTPPDKPRARQGSGTSLKRQRTLIPSKTPLDMNEIRKMEHWLSVGEEICTMYDPTISIVACACGELIVAKRGCSFSITDMEQNKTEFVRRNIVPVSDDDQAEAALHMLYYVAQPQNDRKLVRQRIVWALNRVRELCFSGSSITSKVKRESIEKLVLKVGDRNNQLKDVTTGIETAFGGEFRYISPRLIDSKPVAVQLDPDQNQAEEELESALANLNLNPLAENLSEPPQDTPTEVVGVYNDLRTLNLLAKCRFNIVKVLSRVHVHLSQNEDRPLPRMVGGGRTQIGKTMLKVAIAMLAHRMRFSSVIITPGQLSCLDLCGKMRKDLTKRDDLPLPYPFLLAGDTDENNQKFAGKQIQKFLDSRFFGNDFKGGIAVVNYGANAQLQRILTGHLDAINKDPEMTRRVVFLLDEADDLYKNSDDGKKNAQEIKLKGLLENCAALVVEVTATPAPIFCNILETDVLAYDDIVVLEPDLDAYVKPDDFRFLHSGSAESEGEASRLFLQDGDLCPGNTYMNDNVWRLYDDAVQASTPAEQLTKRSLLIDMTTSRIEVPNGMKDKARLIMERYTQRDESLVIIIATGKGLFYCQNLPDYVSDMGGFFLALPKKRPLKVNNEVREIPFRLEDAIDFIEVNLNWRGPIVVMGYTMLFRGISVRSDSRVPTHMVINMGQANSLERLVQAFGRGTGNFRQVLEFNGFDGVRILVAKDAYEAVCEYPPFVAEVKNAMESDPKLALKDAVDRALAKHNILASGKSIGNKKMFFRDAMLELFPHHAQIPIDFADAEKNAEKGYKTLEKRCKLYGVIPLNGETKAVALAREYGIRRKALESLVAASIGDNNDDSDEYSPCEDDLFSLESILQAFKFKLEEHMVRSDGHCLYHAVLRQVKNHDVESLRAMAADYLERLEESDKQALLASRSSFQTFNELVNAVREHCEWAGEVEIVALSAGLDRKIHVIEEGSATKVFPDDGEDPKTSDIFLLYNGRDHFNALIPVERTTTT